MQSDSIEERLEAIQKMKTEFEIAKRERRRLFTDLKKLKPKIKGVTDAKAIMEEKEEELSDLVEEKEILLKQIDKTLDKYNNKEE